MTDNSDTSAEARTARGRIAAAAAEHDWSEAFGDVASNARIYERSGRIILIGYTPAGTVTSATRMYGSASTPLRTDMPKDELTHLDSGKAEQILAWLAEPASTEPTPPPAGWTSPRQTTADVDVKGPGHIEIDMGDGTFVRPPWPPNSSRDGWR